MDEYNIIKILNERFSKRKFEDRNNELFCNDKSLGLDVSKLNEDINGFLPCIEGVVSAIEYVIDKKKL